MKGNTLLLTRTAALLTLTAALLTLPVNAATASEADPSLQQRIDQVLEDFPGGVQINANEVSWNEGDTILTLADPDSPAALAVGSCATGAHCAYASYGLQGSKMTFNSCTIQSVAPLGAPALSVANARSVVVRAYNSIGAVGSVSANSSADTNWGMTKIGC